MLNRTNQSSDVSQATVNLPSTSFYGWRVLAAATIGLALGYSAIGVVSFGLFVIPLSQAFGWGRGEISFASLVMNITVVLFSPALGFIIDRFGVRRILLPSIVLFASAIASLSLLKGNIHHYYLTYFFLATFGLGTIPATYTRVIVAWFDRRRGMAIGICMAGVGVGGCLIPPYVQKLISTFGWQAGYLGVAALVLFVSWPAVYFLLKETPKEMGQFPDGDALPEYNRTSQAIDLSGFEFADCLRRPTFWLMGCGFMMLGLSTSGLLTHLVPLLQDRGVSPALAALGTSTYGIALIAGRVFCGTLLDRFHAPVVVVCFLLGPVAGLALLASGANGGWAFFAALLFGMGVGAEFDFMSYLVSRYLGRVAYGRIFSLLYGVFSLGGGLGPLLMGYLHDNRGNYDLALAILCANSIVAILPLSRLGAYPVLPIKRDEKDGPEKLGGEISDSPALMTIK